jgi:hypothetical protein
MQQNDVIYNTDYREKEIWFKLVKLFGFPTFNFWAYLVGVVPETRRTH